MLTVVRPASREAGVAALRRSEFGALDEQGLCYLDYTGSAIAARSQLDSHDALLRSVTLGNPHSQNGPASRSTDIIERARQMVLDHLDADPEEYVVCFTANTTAAIKLVAESFPFRSRSSVLLTADNHNSVNGIREYARRAGARVRTIPLTPELRLQRPRAALAERRGVGHRLFAFPAQSNFSGVRHPLSLVHEAQRLGYRVLLDAAAFLPTNALSLREVKPDYLAMSMYKLFGLPTGVGALVARRDAMGLLERPWFAGGTVDWVSVMHQAHRLRAGVDGFEDGTPNFASIAALEPGFQLLRRVGLGAIRDHVTGLTREALASMAQRRHGNGKRVFQVYGPTTTHDRGGTIAFNLLNAGGAIVDYDVVEAHAAREGVAIRGGCFCNPGASERAFGFPAAEMRRCLERLSSHAFTPRRLGDCLGREHPVGALRISVGLANTSEDISRGIDVIAGYVGA